MTIVVCLKVGDGIVLGADSASTMGGPGGVANVYFNAEKITNLRKDLPVGCVTSGLGGFEGRSITHIFKDLRQRLGTPEDPLYVNAAAYTVEEIAIKLRQMVYDELYVPRFEDVEAGMKPPLSVLVGGYSSGQSTAEVWAVEVDPMGNCPQPQCVSPPDHPIALIWRGMGEAVQRLMLGYSDAGLIRLIQTGVPERDARKLLEEQANMVQAGMPIQDGIDLVRFLATTTCDFVKFQVGAPVVAPPIDLAAITRHEGFRWVARKHYFPSELNPHGRSTNLWYGAPEREIAANTEEDDS